MGWPWLREWYCLIFCASLRKCEEQRWEIWSAWRCEWICVCPSQKKHEPMDPWNETWSEPSKAQRALPALTIFIAMLLIMMLGYIPSCSRFQVINHIQKKGCSGRSAWGYAGSEEWRYLKDEFQGHESEMELSFLRRFKQSQITFCNFWLQASIWYSFAAWTPL